MFILIPADVLSAPPAVPAAVVHHTALRTSLLLELFLSAGTQTKHSSDIDEKISCGMNQRLKNTMLLVCLSGDSFLTETGYLSSSDSFKSFLTKLNSFNSDPNPVQVLPRQHAGTLTFLTPLTGLYVAIAS